MQRTEDAGDADSAGRRRVEAVVQTLAALGCPGESLAEVAHDARNMVTALGLYCDLLEEPGVLAVPFAHYGSELRLVAAASRRLVEKLVALDAQAAAEPGPDGLGLDSRGGSGFEAALSDGWSANGLPDPALKRALNRSLDWTAHWEAGGQSMESSPGTDPGRSAGTDIGRSPEPGLGRSAETDLGRSRRWESIFAVPIHDLAAELAANRNLLAALAGPGIAVTVEADGGARPVRLTAEDLTRLLVNLVKNGAEAMPAGGRIQIGLRERPRESGAAEWLELTIEDNGPGIAPEAVEKIFESGFTTHSRNASTNGGLPGNGGSPANGGWPGAHRGLGLAITRSLVEASGGRISASNRTGANSTGARFEIQLPVSNS
jgi:hypothetical protein